MASSANASSVGRMARPSALAVFALVGISNLVGCSGYASTSRPSASTFGRWIVNTVSGVTTA
jgi:hypothetical protein